jgi:thiamine biosynthesis lipoprotein
MGTQFRILLYASDAGVAREAQEAAWRRLEELDARLSDYRVDSEVSLLSASSSAGAPTQARAVSEDLWLVLNTAQEVWRSSDGAFDVTVGPLVRVWRRAARRGQFPARGRLEEARTRVGGGYILLDPSCQSVQLSRANIRLDLGGIAKGYALDEALAVLARHGVNRALVDGGGDVAAGAPPPGSDGWRIQVAGAPPGELAILAHAAVATSGGSARHLDWQGVRYSHIVDPRTGLGLTHGHAVTVIAGSAMRADALASAACVLGPQRGLEWIEDQAGAEAQFRSEEKLAEVPCDSSGYRRRMQFAPGPMGGPR